MSKSSLSNLLQMSGRTFWQPWVDQNFLVSIDPNLEEITNFFSLNWSQSRGDYKFQSKLFERLKNVKNWPFLAFFDKNHHFQSMCNPCAHGSRPEFREKINLAQSMKIFSPRIYWDNLEWTRIFGSLLISTLSELIFNLKYIDTALSGLDFSRIQESQSRPENF